MHGHFGRFALASLLVLGAILACNLPSVTPTATLDLAATWVAATLTALGPGASAPNTAPTVAVTNTPVPTNTIPPSATPTPAKPVVIKDSLCSVGPGSNYEVVSAVKTGTEVELIGRGSIAGWYIINNPIYHDPCWIAAASLQIDPSFNVSALKVIVPPPSPTPKPSRTPVPTPTT
jgi:uncharacterized protein YgiM (DUF1202 family)